MKCAQAAYRLTIDEQVPRVADLIWKLAQKATTRDWEIFPATKTSPIGRENRGTGNTVTYQVFFVVVVNTFSWTGCCSLTPPQNQLQMLPFIASGGRVLVITESVDSVLASLSHHPVAYASSPVTTAAPAVIYA